MDKPKAILELRRSLEDGTDVSLWVELSRGRNGSVVARDANGTRVRMSAEEAKIAAHVLRIS